MWNKTRSNWDIGTIVLMADARPEVGDMELEEDVPDQSGHTPNDSKSSANGFTLTPQADRYGFLRGNQYTDPEE